MSPPRGPSAQAGEPVAPAAAQTTNSTPTPPPAFSGGQADAAGCVALSGAAAEPETAAKAASGTEPMTMVEPLPVPGFAPGPGRPSPARLTDLAALRALCAAHGFSLSKGFGQNFIINPGVCPRMAEASGIDASFGVLEIGPGVGVLTRELAARAAKVAAIELDERLFPLLRQTLAGYGNVRIIPGDAMKLDLAALIKQEFAGLRVAVCANLPYYITSPLLMRLLEERLPIESITVMVQKEAAERLCAAPGSRAAGAVSCAVRYYAEPRQLFAVQPGSFWPAPKVTSAVIRLALLKTPPIAPPDEAGFFRLVRAAFGQRRKAAANAISAGLGLPKPQVAAAMRAAGLAPLARPEQLTLADFCALQSALAAQGPQNAQCAPDAPGAQTGLNA